LIEVYKAGYNKGINDDDMKVIVSVCDTTEEEVNRDLQKYKDLGYTVDIFNSISDLKDVEVVNSALLLLDNKNYNLQ
jgi:hypothetical protein